MWALKQANKPSISQEALIFMDKIALYDRYGSIAYGIILHVIPEPELAQKVLVDLFMSPQIQACTEIPTTGEIIRLARAKALASKTVSNNSSLASTALIATNDTTDLAKLVFNLSFCQGCSTDIIAEKLNLSPTNVLKAFYTYFKYLRSS
ncbi:hypothetical protein [Spirosoma validum]|uniref:Uncharacterized protein n=1 Tax=Spirosoma validum TaxID=2771355 RepID=A0A927B8R4_9BACT|nr:hypothetical protein [Spirosoma validum]MBD2757545.1 hypothetical protein [Spirosoma validum]